MLTFKSTKKVAKGHSQKSELFRASKLKEVEGRVFSRFLAEDESAPQARKISRYRLIFGVQLVVQENLLLFLLLFGSLITLSRLIRRIRLITKYNDQLIMINSL